MDNEKRRLLKEQYKTRRVTGGVYRVRCARNGRFFMEWDENLDGAEAIFHSAMKAGYSRPDLWALNADLKAYGPEAFSFERLESLEKEEGQTNQEFYDDLRTLLELCKEKTDIAGAYKK